MKKQSINRGIFRPGTRVSLTDKHRGNIIDLGEVRDTDGFPIQSLTGGDARMHVKSNDPFLPILRGTVVKPEDNSSQVLVCWDGLEITTATPASQLRVLVGEYSDRVLDQVTAIRDSGETNMFDVPMVQAIANREGFHELVLWLVDHKREYLDLILNGPK